MSTAPPSTKYVVARTGDIPDGERLIVDVHGRSIGVFNVGGRFHALLNRCPHQGAELCRGTVHGALEADAPGRIRYDASRRLLRCPWHGWEFDLSTGQSYFDPARTRVRSYRTEVQSGELAKGPYTAEVIPVSVEDDYVVLWLRG
jgi:3-phenylpropionate/trans-cinnamate dioxygenase ferredoxin subunit